ncbi:exodeoxyribonuclease-3 [Microlunatus soli]|uniref:Exodeoxyribonuclease-3 n=1 Tax=Microlunatus soli TaxID=630515 RepID=A0A1H1W9C9_9ACTN|nr:exodeoxyribonuclease-3 [Microlunatus soli]
MRQNARVLRIASLNVNGIRAAVRRGFDDWLSDRDPDIVGLQEMRCPVDQLPVLAGYHLSYHPGELAGRNGVAVLTRRPPIAVRHGFGNRRFDAEGRYLEVDCEPADGHPGLTIGSLYLPKGDRPTDGPAAEAKHRRKLSFMASLRGYLTRARKRAQSEGREFVIMGDFNIAHTALDLRNWRSNRKNSGFLPDERDWFASILGPRTLHDVVRRLHGEEPGPYSWWTWRGQAFDQNTGWRIDYQLATPELASTATTGGTDREPSYQARMSDHSQVVVDYNL